MIFINTRPVDENAQCDRRPSKAPSHTGNGQHNEGSSHIIRLSLSFLLFYVLVSIFLSILFYPISLISIAVPLFSLFFALCSLRTNAQHSQSPILFIAIIGILVKIAALIIYISIFPLKDNARRLTNSGPRAIKTEAEMKHYRTVFYVILTSIEILILIIGMCLKWQLVTLQEREQIQKRRSTLTSNRVLISDDRAARRSIQA